MQPSDKKIQDLLRMEVADKSPQSVISFALFSLLIFFYHFNCTKYALGIQFGMVMVFTVSISRLILCRQIKQQGHVTNSQWQMMVLYVVLNAVGWSLAFSLASLELKLQGLDFIILTTMLTGFVSAALITLAYDFYLFIPFQTILLAPQLGIILYFYFGPEKVNSLPLFPIYLLYLLYQIRQFKNFRSQLSDRLRYQFELEDSYEELQKSKDALIEQTAKLVHTSRLAALGEMSAGIAHEVNNPLAIISGSVQQIEKLATRGEIDLERVQKLSEKSQLGVERITKIIKGLRHFSQQSDSQPKAYVSLEDIIQETSNFCSEMLAARYIQLLIEPIPNVKIECNPVQISQVLINLIKNAEDSIVGQEAPETDRWIKITFHKAPTHMTIEVSNGGKKINEHFQTKLFQPFFTTKPIGKGTGLGLSISRGIMREHQGDLVFDQNALNTTFAIQLPY